MQSLAKTHQLIVINVFTSPGSLPSTLSARSYLHQCGMADPQQLYSVRLQEDSQVLAGLQIKPVNLGLIEALWRTRPGAARTLFPELSAVYPTYRWHIIRGRISPYDRNTRSILASQLSSLIPKRSLVFVPLGIGNHVDHLLVRNTVRDLHLESTVYWADYPYLYRDLPDRTFISENHLQPEIYQFDLLSKQQLMSGYRSQTSAVFPNGFSDLPPEQFFYAT